MCANQANFCDRSENRENLEASEGKSVTREYLSVFCYWLHSVCVCSKSRIRSKSGYFNKVKSETLVQPCETFGDDWCRGKAWLQLLQATQVDGLCSSLPVIKH